jgi:hypothetical protein
LRVQNAEGNSNLARIENITYEGLHGIRMFKLGQYLQYSVAARRNACKMVVVNKEERRGYGELMCQGRIILILKPCKF